MRSIEALLRPSGRGYVFSAAGSIGEDARPPGYALWESVLRRILTAMHQLELRRAPSGSTRSRPV